MEYRSEYDTGQVSDGHSVRALVSEMVQEGRTLLRAEIDLARGEVKAEAKKAARSGGLFGAAGVIGLLGAMALVSFIIIALAGAIAAWAAALIVGVALCAVAGILAAVARKRLKDLQPPNQTLESLKEDQRWAKQTMLAVKSQLRGNA